MRQYFNWRRYLSNFKLLTLIAILIITVSLFYSYSTKEWHWFGRSGAWATIIGVFLSVRPLIRMGFSEWIQSQSIIDLGNLDPTPEEIEEDKQVSKDAHAVKIGVFLSITGTLVWAYGDLIGGLLN